MKAYLLTTGGLFVLLVLSHVARVFVEPAVGRQPFFLLITTVSLALAVWAFKLLRSAKATP